MKAKTIHQPINQALNKEDYSFTGWYVDQECTTLYTDGTPMTKALDLYGKWVRVVPTGIESDMDNTWMLFAGIGMIMMVAGGVFVATKKR